MTRIAAVEPHPLRLPAATPLGREEECFLLRIVTEDGTEGWGEAHGSPWLARAVVEAPVTHVTAQGLRHILLGGLIAAGMGSLSMAVITAWLGLPSQAIPAGGAAGSAAYLVGVFGPAFIEVVLARLRSGKGGTPDA